MRTLSVYWRVLRHNADFRRLYLARLISFGGDWFLVVPLVGLVYEASDSAFAAASVIAVQAIPALVLAPLTGTIADRFDRKTILVTADIIRACLVLSLLAVDSFGGIWFPLTIMALDGAGAAFFYPASGAALPNVVPTKDLGPANVLMSSAWGAMAAIGAGLGGVVAAALSRDAAFVVNSISFIVSAILIARISVSLQEKTRAVTTNVIEAVRDALSYAKDHNRVAALLTAKAVHSLTSGGAVGLFAVVSFVLFDTGDGGTGLLFGARGVGNLVGPIIAFRLVGANPRRTFGSIGYAMALWGAAYLFVGVAPTLALAGLGVCVAHMGGGTQFTFSTYGLQEFSPDQVRGRIFALDFGLSTLAIAVSSLAIGALAEVYTVRSLLLGLGVAGVVFGLTWTAVTASMWADLPPKTPQSGWIR
ncbi:MAG: MFS transporter [Acidimicrobiia bacterium]|nr:MFS transporter [Acidimicrobiia bacterium]